MEMMEYNGFQAKVEIDDETKLFHGKVINLRDVITFEVNCMNDLLQAFHDSFDDYLEFCREREVKEPEKPPSG
jgi:predicted HicB family RNase H-like nuclease